MKYKSIDLNAPIIPGKSAAGLTLGDSIETINLENFVEEIRKPSPTPEKWTYVYFGDDLILFFENNLLKQIGVQGGYTGKYEHKFGIGSTICQAQQELDLCCIESIWDTLEFYDVVGICFETATYAGDYCKAPIAQIFVFPEPYDDVTYDYYDVVCSECLSEKWKLYWSLH